MIKLDTELRAVHETYRNSSRACFIGKQRGMDEPLWSFVSSLYDVRSIMTAFKELSDCRCDYVVVELDNVQYPDLFV